MTDPILIWTEVAAIGQLAGATATFLAVVTSLWIATSERREDFSLSVGQRIIVSEGEPEIKVVSFELVNKGVRSIHISSFGWRVGWLRKGPKSFAYSWAYQTSDIGLLSNNPPFTLDAGRSASFLIRLERFTDNIPQNRSLFGQRKLGLLGTFNPPIHGVVYTSRGTRRTASIEPALKEIFNRSGR